jgi:hypothetical protein
MRCYIQIRVVDYICISNAPYRATVVHFLKFKKSNQAKFQESTWTISIIYTIFFIHQAWLPS